MALQAFGVISIAQADPPQLVHPVDCVLGETCFIQNYVDHDPSPDYADFSCGPLSYDGHKGTDFALPSLEVMMSGVSVLAAAPGVVSGVRDGMPDQEFNEQNAATVQGRDCGNGVAIDHGDGWVTQYCHMKQDSVAVTLGQRVTTGETLGQVGLSGRTQFPHLHISLRQNERVVDPFRPDPKTTNCAPSPQTLWKSPTKYVPGGLIQVAFAPGIPQFKTIKSGMAAHPKLPAQAKALVLFAYGFGSRAGDSVILEIIGPQGNVLTHTEILEKTQAQYFRASGRRTPMGGWLPGVYHGKVEVLRDGVALDSGAATVLIQ
ncbi:M23 family metallopeptidase [Shimia abyssi]|nr:M23 family metallopeptidase [Shimia abyssi]